VLIASSGVALGLTLITGPRPAAASLIVRGNAVLDTSSNLEWLQGSVTHGLTPAAALANNPGYQLATQNQLEGLFEDAGVPAGSLPGSYTGPGFLSIGAALTAIFNYNIFSSYPPSYEDFAQVLNTAGTGTDEAQFIINDALFFKDLELNLSPFAIPANFVSADSRAFDLLVKPAAAVPEPPTLSIFAVALIALALAGQRKRSKTRR
jgi:hypothetical protein